MSTNQVLLSLLSLLAVVVVGAQQVAANQTNALAKELDTNGELQAALKLALSFADALKKEAKFWAHNGAPTLALELDPETHLLKEAKRLMKREDLFRRIQTRASLWLGSLPTTCSGTLDKFARLVKRLDGVKDNMSKEEKRFAKSNKQAAKVLALRGFLKKIVKRRSSLCSSNFSSEYFS